ncbi:MAG: glycosyltransferase [Bacteroidales bacterium]|nr:glycosyltransferase [Bacteroidales bacterium]
MKTFSIIIPIYKVERYIAACVQSCLDQKTDNFELILVDDGSPDMSVDIARRIVGPRPDVTIISQSNAGLSAARNAGLARARGEYVWFVDADDRIEPDCLGYLESLCGTHRPDIVSFCAADVIDGNVCRRFSRKEGECRIGADFIRKGDLQVCAPFSLFKREFLASRGLEFVKGIFHEDSEFTPRAYYYADKVVCSDRILYYVSQNPDSITRSVNPQKAFDSIRVVQARISRFSKEADSSCRTGFNDLISSDFNHALKNSFDMDESQRAELDRVAYENRYLLHHLIAASRLKYKISGLVYSLFPRHISGCYRLMQGLRASRGFSLRHSR